MGTFSKSLVRRLSGHAPHAARPVNLPANEVQIALHDGRKLWLQRVPSAQWTQLSQGAQLMLIRSCHQHKPWQQALEMATLDHNGLAHPGAPHLCIAWGWAAEDKPDKRPGTILMLHELHLILRYELRRSNSPEVVATINPSLN